MQTLIRRALLIALLSLFIIPSLAQTESCERIDDRPAWDGRSPFNLLVLGMDRRPGARDTLNVRTDVLMVVRYDPQNGTIGVLDIPRDMHFAVLNMRETLLRVNTLMVEGESIAEGCGPYFAMETFQLNLGMYIDAYIAFDFVGFMEFIDAIGGVTIDVPYPINDPTYPDMNYGYDPLYLAAGVQQMDGETALKYARTRHGDNDYERGLRQLAVVMAVKDQLSDPRTLQMVLANAPAIVDTLNGHFYSNLTAEQIATLGVSVIRQDIQDVRTGSINLDYSYSYNYRGNRVQVPDRERLSALLIEIFGEQYWR